MIGASRLLTAFLLVLLAAICNCGRNRCPRPEAMPDDCFCQHNKVLEVHCKGNGENVATIEEIAATLRQNFPANATTIGYLEFDKFKQPNALTSRTFEGLPVKILFIRDTNITSWADEFGGPAFVGLEDTLEELYIWSSIFLADKYRGETVMPAPFSMGHLRRLTRVWLHSNRLYVFGKDWFGSFGTSVKMLSIGQNKVHVVAKEALVGLKNMQVLLAGINYIKELNRNMFSADSKLEDLDLAWNNLKGFPEDFFVNFSSLRELYLTGNPITFLPEKVFGKIWSQLELLDHGDFSDLHCGDNINWMLNIKRPANLNVLCETPAQEHGKRLGDVLDKREKNREFLNKVRILRILY